MAIKYEHSEIILTGSTGRKFNEKLFIFFFLGAMDRFLDAKNPPILRDFS
jgi:hypothetical protein